MATNGNQYIIRAPRHWTLALLGESATPKEARDYRAKLAHEGRVIVSLAGHADRAETGYLANFIAYGE